jgi:hypothetical protein
MTIEPGTVLTTVDAVATAEVGEETVLLHLERSVYYGLNEVGSRVWTLLEEPTPFEELCEKMVEEYDVDSATCRDDLRTLLNDLYEHDLIRRPKQER